MPIPRQNLHYLPIVLVHQIKSFEGGGGGSTPSWGRSPQTPILQNLVFALLGLTTLGLTTLLLGRWSVAQAQRSPLLEPASTHVQLASQPIQNFASAYTKQTPILLEPSWAEGTIDLFTLDASIGGHTRPVYSVAFSPDSNYLASGSADQTIKIWNLGVINNPQIAPIYATLSNGNAQVTAIAFSPNGQFLANGSLDGTVRLWDWHNSRLLHTLSLHTDKVETVAFSPDGQVLASAGGDKIIRFWDVNTGALISEIESEQWVTSLVFSQDGILLVSGGLGRQVDVWEWQAGKTIASFTDYLSPIYSVALSPDAQIVAFSPNSVSPEAAAIQDEDVEHNTIYLLNLDGEEVMAPLTGHTDYITSLAFSPTGRFLLSGSWDNTIKLWDMQTEQLFRDFSDVTSQRVLSIVFSPNGRMFACGDGNANIQLFVSVETP